VETYRARQPLWPIVVLALVVALMAFMVREVLVGGLRPAPDPGPLIGLYYLLNTVLFGAPGVFCAAVTGIAVWRRLARPIELRLDEGGLEIINVWSRKRFQWRDIERLSLRSNWMIVDGVAMTGRRGKQSLNIGQLDRQRAEITARIEQMSGFRFG
jgi:hypothetical protein